MKKIILCLMVGALMLGMLGCTQRDEELTDAQTKVQEEEPVKKELTDPRGKTLESTATGEANPQLVTTKYETTDVVIADYVPSEMGYAVDPTGATDSTAGLQQALYDCFNNGGGTVYLPAGNYAISDTVYIPPFVTLRGDWQDPDVGTEYGTIISVWMEAEDQHIAGAFKLGGSGGVVGLTIYYPLQTLDCIMPYPFAIYVDGQGANFMLSTVRNVTIINGYRGVGTAINKSHESLQIENLKGTFLNCGLYITNSSDVGTVENLVVSGKYWKEAAADCMNTELPSKINAFTEQYTTGMILGDLEWTEFASVSIENCNMGIHVVEGDRIEFAGTLYDVSVKNCEQGVVFDGLDERWGAAFANSTIDGSFINNTHGKIKLTNVTVTGSITEKDESSVWVDETDLSAYQIDYDRTYVKPNETVVVAELADGLFTDAGPDLQKYVDEVAAKGGGVVYVPGGTYRFRSAVTVPAGVEVRGSSSVATRGQSSVCKGTLFQCYYGDDGANGAEDAAFITLAGENAGINGVRIIYPENSVKTNDINSTYAIRGTAKGVYAVNCMISAAAYGIDFRDCDNHYIEGLMTCCYYNAFRLGGENGFMARNLQNGTVLQRTKAPGLVDWISTSSELFDLLFDPLLREACEYIIVDGAENQMICNTFAYGVRTALTVLNSENTCAINIGNDNLNDDAPQIKVDGGELTGINVMRYNGYSYDLEKGNISLYNRIAINEIGEKTLEKSK